MTIALMEAQVFAKPYFQPQNLLVAEIEGKIVGMAHLVEYGPLLSAEFHAEVANIPMILAGNIPNAAEVEDRLVEECERRVRETSTQLLLLGGTHEPGPFYFGLAKGSCNRGAMVSDQRMIDLAERHSYEATHSWKVCNRALRGFRPPVDRTQIAARRALHVLREDDPPYTSYREACIFMQYHQTRYTLVQKLSGQRLAQLKVVQMDAFSHLRGVRTCGIVDLDHLNAIDANQSKFFLAEMLRQISEDGTAMVEAQVSNANPTLCQLTDALGFETFDEVRIMAKHL